MKEGFPEPDEDPICGCGHPLSMHSDRDCRAAGCLCQIFHGHGASTHHPLRVNQSEHWERIYTSRAPEDVSWYESVPAISLRLVAEAIERGAESCIDVGGGASRLVDHLLALGLRRVAVLDISESGLAVSKRRLGDRAAQVEWIVGDVTSVEDIGQFDIWHDRAVFHFLTAVEDRQEYVRLAERTLPPGATAVMATFDRDGPERCSGLDVQRYDASRLAEQCGAGFELSRVETHVHVTPRGATQSFLYASFHRSSVWNSN